MNFTSFFIKRTVLTTLMALTLLLAGIITFKVLPVSALPKLDFPAIRVNVNLPGASPEIMGKMIALPLERSFATIPGITSIISNSILGSTVIVLQFDLNRNIDAAAQDVSQAISQAQNVLPSNLPSPPTYKKIDPSEQPVLYIVLNSDILPLYKINDYAQQISDQLTILEGVAEVDLIGSQQFAVRVYVDPKMAATRGLSLGDISKMISESNVNSPTGQLSGDIRNYSIKPNSELFEAKDYDNIVIGSTQNHLIRIKDIGYAVDSVENDQTLSWGSSPKLSSNNQKCILLAISRQPGSNTIEVVDRVLQKLPQIQSWLPSTVSLNIEVDRSEPIRQSIKDVEFSFCLSLVLVILVIYLFLQNFKMTLIPLLTLPLSVLATFFFMYYLGYSLNNLTLLGLTLAVGFIVDDAIVMLENINHHAQNGLTPLQATLRGSSEISFTIVSMTLSLIAVFFPIIFLPGILGRLFHEFGMTVSLVIIMSGFTALAITPLMCRYLVKQQSHSTNIWGFEKFQNWFKKLELFYINSLKWVMTHQKLTLTSLGLIFLLNILLFITIPKGFFPNEDAGLIYGTIQGNTEASFEKMLKAHDQVNVLFKSNPNIDTYTISLGSSSTLQAANSSRFFIKLKDFSQRSVSVDQVMKELAEKFENIPSLKIYMQSLQNLRVGTTSTMGQYIYTLQGVDTHELYPIANKMEKELDKISMITNVGSDLLLNSPQLKILIDRDRASSLGVSINEINNTLNLAFGAQQISLIYGNLNAFQVIFQILKDQTKTPEDLHSIFVKSNTGKLIRLDTIASFTQEAVALTENHYNQLPSVNLSFNLQPGIALGNVMDKIKELEEKHFLGHNIQSTFQGSAQVYKDSTQGEGWLLMGAVVAIYIVLGMLYESFIHPLTILSGIPTAGIGALLALYITGLPLDAVSFIGIILLIGIVKKNAIMMVDYALECKKIKKMKSDEAIFEGAIRRFRPIMMTTFAALFGTLPIALGWGASAALRQPMGIAIIGGLIVSQLLTLYITPVVFIWMDQFSKKKNDETQDFFIESHG